MLKVNKYNIKLFIIIAFSDTTIISIWIELYTRIISLLHIISINTVNIYQSTSTVIFSSLLKLIGNLKQSPSSNKYNLYFI